MLRSQNRPQTGQFEPREGHFESQPGSIAKRAPLIPLGLPLVAKLCIEVCDRAMKKAIEKDSCNRIVDESQEKRAIE